MRKKSIGHGQKERMETYQWTMLRSLTPHEPELLRLCRSSSWIAVSLRSHSHPLEATPSESCLRGEGSTALSIAIRSQAPKNTIQALLAANFHQIGVTHRNRGSILHEAIKYNAPDEVLGLILRSAIQYQQTMMPGEDNYQEAAGLGHVQFRHVQVQENRLISGPNLLGIQDEFGRTALHCMVEKSKRVADNCEQSKKSWPLFQMLLLAHPESIQVMDSDGNSPLVLLLQTPRPQSSATVEANICRMVELILSECPDAVTLSGKLPRPWRFLPLPAPTTHSPVCSPLYYALLHGRSSETIKLLLKAHRQCGLDGCSAIVSQYYEVCLHIAVSTKASAGVLHNLIIESPDALVAQDVYGLTPIDWLWIRHVLDWNSNPQEIYSTRIVSRRRYLGNDFLEWHKFASTTCIPMEHDPQLPIDSTAVRRLQHDLLQRIRLLVPMTASVLAKEPLCYKEQQGEPSCWSLLHSVCYVPFCPLAMVRIVLNIEPKADRVIRSKDSRAGRYPLHYAASRVGYRANLRLGVSRGVHVLQEQSPVMEILPRFPEACRATDSQGQLPLHIAIDAWKHHRQTSAVELSSTDDEVDEIEMLTLLLSHYPPSQDRRDGKTKLYPWQQAAVGSGASLNATYFLLRRHPSLFGSKELLNAR